MVVIADNETAVHVHKRSARFRRTPVAMALGDTRKQQDTCDRTRGHVLMAKDGKLVCESCGAEWKDEGF